MRKDKNLTRKLNKMIDLFLKKDDAEAYIEMVESFDELLDLIDQLPKNDRYQAIKIILATIRALKYADDKSV